MQPEWSFLKDVFVWNCKNNKRYKFISSRNLNPTNEQFNSIVQACNSAEIFKWIFREMCPNGYTRENAIGFVNWAKQGWVDNSHFVFFLLSDGDNIVGALDIKSNNLQAGEIGYWVHQDHSGLASNAISILKDFAKQAGYQILFAQTKKGNEKSNQALLRNLFEINENYKNDTSDEKAFSIKL